MPKKKYLNGIILGILFALAILALAGTFEWLGWLEDMIISMSTWFQSQNWMPEFLTTVTWFKWLIAGVIGLIIGLFIEIK